MNVKGSRLSLFIVFAIFAVLALLSALKHRDPSTHVFSWQRPGYGIGWPVSYSSVLEAPWEAAANATLGFQSIFALSTGTPWRVDGLRAAANLTGLDITFPRQPPIPKEVAAMYETLGGEEAEHPTHGATLAWIAHIDLLQHVVQGDYASALIVEDDLDWDVALREKVIVPVAQGVRNYTHVPLRDTTTPYGDDWDLLWLGHCGEWSHDDMPYHAWQDETVIPHSEYVGWAAADLQRLPEGARTTHPTTSSVCTFAYAVTARGARKLLDTMSLVVGEAFDVVLAQVCRARKLHCITIHPEIFHHHELSSEDGDSSNISVVNNDEDAVDKPLSEMHMGHTPNIRHSARCQALYNSTCQRLP